MASISAQDLYCGVKEACLERQVIPDRFHEVSRYLSRWKLLAPKLNIPPAEVEKIEAENSTDEAQRDSFLKKWHDLSEKATYKALVDSLWSIGQDDDARGICGLLTGMLGPLTRINMEEQPHGSVFSAVVGLANPMIECKVFLSP